jgi:hypothetical protein
MASGGLRPGAPQNNPANVSGTGGNGQSGDYSGFAYGQNKAINESRVAGNAAVSAINTAAPTAPERPALPEVTPITAPSAMPDQHILEGLSPLGQPNNIPGLPNGQDTSVDAARLVSYLPALEHAASMPTSSEAFRNYVRLVRANTTGSPQ